MQTILNDLSPHLQDDDDLQLWSAVLNVAIGDINRRFEASESTRDLYLLMGPCSKWLRPHQTRLLIHDREFAWPSGYGGTSYSRSGLPELDWCCCFKRNQDQTFDNIDVPYKITNRKLAVRIAVPARSLGRHRASVNLMWTHGTPENPRRPIVRLLAFNKIDVNWNFYGGLTHDGESWTGGTIPPPNKRKNASRN